MWQIIASLTNKVLDKIPTINSDESTPLNVTLGKKTDTASATASSSIFSWIKNIQGLGNTANTNIDAINNYMGVKTLVCPAVTTVSQGQPANVDVSSLPSLAQIVGFNVSHVEGLVNNIGPVTINGIEFESLNGHMPAFKASDMPSVRETNSVTVTSHISNNGTFILTIYYRL